MICKCGNEMTETDPGKSLEYLLLPDPQKSYTCLSCGRTIHEFSCLPHEIVLDMGEKPAGMGYFEWFNFQLLQKAGVIHA